MSRSHIVFRKVFVSLLAAPSLALAVPASATPAPSAVAMQSALAALMKMRPLTAIQTSDDIHLLSRQASPTAARRSRPPDPETQVGAANDAARIQPEDAGFQNAIQRYAYSEGALFQIYAKPGQVTDIALQEGERLVGPGPVAAGDTVRWMIGDTLSGAGATQRVHILVKPTRPDITTNLVINTDRRTYHMELRSTERTYMASVSWQYPQDQLIALRRQNAEAQAAQPVSSGIDLANVNFRYEVTGDRAAWRPLRAFDDGRQVFIEFPRGIGQGEMPPLFVVGPEGDTSELVNYRVRGNYMIVDRLFAAAELRFGAAKDQKRVRISRTDGRPAS